MSYRSLFKFAKPDKACVEEPEFRRIQEGVAQMIGAMSEDTIASFLRDMRVLDPDLCGELEKNAMDYADTIAAAQKELCAWLIAKAVEYAVDVKED